jgi:hypothetical protein
MDATIIGCLACLAEMADQTGRQARAQPEQAAVNHPFCKLNAATDCNWLARTD